MMFLKKQKNIVKPKEEKMPGINPAVEKLCEMVKDLNSENMNEKLSTALTELGVECPWGDWGDWGDSEAFDDFMLSDRPLIFQ